MFAWKHVFVDCLEARHSPSRLGSDTEADCTASIHQRIKCLPRHCSIKSPQLYFIQRNADIAPHPIVVRLVSVRSEFFVQYVHVYT